MIKPISTQKIILLCGAIAFILCGLFPPWLYISYEGHTHAAGIKFILSPPTIGNLYSKLDVARLAVEWLCITVATGTVLLLIHKPQKAISNGQETPDKPVEAASSVDKLQVNSFEKRNNATFSNDKAEEAQIQAIAQKTDHELLAMLKQLDDSHDKVLYAVRTELKKRFGVI